MACTCDVVSSVYYIILYIMFIIYYIMSVSVANVLLKCILMTR